MSTTPEDEFVLIFRGAYSDLVQGTSSDPALLAAKLWSVSIIGLQAKREAEVSSVSPLTRATALISAVGEQIKVAPKEKFPHFVKILKEEKSLLHLAKLLDPSVEVPDPSSEASGLPSSTNSQTEFQESFSPDEVAVWLRRIGLLDKDIKLLQDDGFGTAPGFKTLTVKDLTEMKVSRAGQRLLSQHLAAQPPPTVSIPTGKTTRDTSVSSVSSCSMSLNSASSFEVVFSADEIADAVGLDSHCLDVEFPDNNVTILSFSKCIEDWFQFATTLGFTGQILQDILTNTNLSYRMKTVEVLKRWKSRLGFKGTYRVLIEACLRQDNTVMATNMCHLIKETLDGLSTPPPAPYSDTEEVPPPISQDQMVDKALTINNLVEVLKTVLLTRSNNGILGRSLKVPDYKISEYEANNVSDISQVRIEILLHWMRNEPQDWNAIVNAATDLGERNLAKRIRTYRVIDEASL